jgi:hypothetical protein
MNAVICFNALDTPASTACPTPPRTAGCRTQQQTWKAKTRRTNTFLGCSGQRHPESTRAKRVWIRLIDWARVCHARKVGAVSDECLGSDLHADPEHEPCTGCHRHQVQDPHKHCTQECKGSAKGHTGEGKAHIEWKQRVEGLGTHEQHAERDCRQWPHPGAHTVQCRLYIQFESPRSATRTPLMIMYPDRAPMALNVE